MDTLPTQRKVAVISGGTGYLGSLVANQLARDGMIIALLYQTSPEEKVEQILHNLSGIGHKAYKCNLESRDEVDTTINIIEKEMGPLFACVHTAGKKPNRKKLLSSSLTDIEEQIRGNSITSFNFLSMCAKRLQEYKKGVLIGVTTIGVVSPKETASLGAYIPAKFAVQGMLTVLKEEMKSSHISVYSVAPGFMEGGMNSDVPKAFIEILKEKSVTNKITTKEDVAKLILDLCKAPYSEKADLTVSIAPELGIL